MDSTLLCHFHLKAYMGARLGQCPGNYWDFLEHSFDSGSSTNCLMSKMRP